MASDKFGLDDAYAVETPDDNRALYRDWAETYESDFVRARGYVYGKAVAELFADAAETAGIHPDSQVVDVGCGTGIVGVALAERGFSCIDGFDISPEMLNQAANKNAYRSLIEVDLTEPVVAADDLYAGVLSVGTFTHGHLGPEPLRELVRIAAPNALFAIGVNAEHYESHGFAELLAELGARGLINDLRLVETPMYDNASAGDEHADDKHADDKALVAIYRKLPRS